jgi:hypothetical protein
MVLRCLLLWSLVVGAATAAEDVPAVPDPAGLGERLALIDYLQSHGQTVTTGAELAQLRLQYRELLLPTPVASAGSARDQAVLELWRTYNEAPPEGATLEQITDRLHVLAAKAASARDGERSREDADDRAAQLMPHILPQAATAEAPQGELLTPPAPHPGAPAAPLAEIREVARPQDMGPSVHAYLISPALSPILIVVLNPELREPVETVLRTWPAAWRHDAGIDATVIIHGHSSGAYFSRGVITHPGAVGGDLAEHLRRNREYYETLGGSRERKPIDFAVMTGCNLSGCNQEAELRDGFGYRPLHRVFTAPDSVDAACVVLPTIIRTGSISAGFTPFHASFTWYQTIPEDGKACSISCYAAIDDQALDVHDHLRRFTVSPTGIQEAP